MTSFKTMLLAAAVFAVPSTANAALVGSLGGGTGPFRTLTSAGLDDGAIATLSGGAVYTADLPFADIPEGDIAGNAFLAAGVQAGQPAVLNFTNPTTYVSFLWGSPDVYNRLSLTTSVATYAFDVASLGFAVRDGNQSFSQYVQFAASAGETITSLSFSNAPMTDAFEVANFTVTAVPEPATWGMMLLGFGMVAGAARYRRRSTKVVYA
uniref:PEPxxWA-CTERM sorting domain-containing protein n=1 Tax=Sphingomonas sp. CFBP 8760 TaxID=2775282 RepID=UPI001FCEBBAC|nr:PEPxxWA-CTERM sorting domain-containing protein [Sphingomonas sp. CFBP 8760]